MPILALDLGMTTGWAVDDGERVYSGVKQMPTNGERWRVFLDYLDGFHADYEPDTLVVEKPIAYPGRASGTRVLFGLAALAEMWAQALDVEMHEIPPATIKKHATGNGRADKHAMVIAAKELFSKQEIQDHNQADALCALYAWRMMEEEG